MTSKLVVNTIEADTGISSVSFASSISMNSTSKFHFSAAGVDIGADTNINRPAAGVLGFNISGAEKLRIDTNGHLNTSGIVTAANFKSGVTNVHNLGVTLTGGQLDVGSNIKIGTAGVVTATSFVGSGANLTGLNSDLVNDTSPQLGGNLDVNTKNILFGDSNDGSSDDVLKFGAGSDLQLHSDGTNGVVRQNNNSGGLYIQADNFVQIGKVNAGSPIYGKFIKDGAVELYHNGTKKFETTSSGATLSGDLYATSRLLVNTTSAGESNGDEATFANPGGNAGITIRSAVNNECKIYFSEGTSGGSQYRGAINYNQNTNYMSFSTNENERMRIKSDGDVSMSAPSNYTDPYRLYLRYRADTHATLVIDSRPDALTTKHIRFYYALHGSGGGSELGSVTSSNAGSVNYNTSSDYRRKQNDVVITDGIAKVKNLRPIRFNWIEQPDITEEGFFAHEAQEVVPNSVFGAKDAVDKDGNPDYQVMDHSKLVPLLTASIKDLITKVETLEAEVAALKGS